MIFPSGFVLVAGSYPDHIQASKDFIKEHGLTNEDVNLLGNDDEIIVITKKEIDFK